ncbi:MAG: hypothetical protein U0169_06335 [Polyangiaceae bacterium]
MHERAPDSDSLVRPFVAEMASSQLEFTASLFELGLKLEERSVLASPPVASYVRDLHGALERLRRALQRVLLDAPATHVRPLLVRHAPLTEFVRGLYAWTQAILHATDGFVVDATKGAPDWRRLARRVDEARAFYFHDLEHVLRREWAIRRRDTQRPSGAPAAIDFARHTTHLDELFSAASSLARRAEPKAPRARVHTFGRWLAEGLVPRAFGRSLPETRTPEPRTSFSSGA